MKGGEHLASVLPREELREIRSGRMERKLQNLFQTVKSSCLWNSLSWEVKDAHCLNHIQPDRIMHWKMYCRQESCRNWAGLEYEKMDWMS